MADGRLRLVVFGHCGAGKTTLTATGLAEARLVTSGEVRAGWYDRWRLHRIDRRLARGDRPAPTRRQRGYAAHAGVLRLTVLDHPGLGGKRGRRLAADLIGADAAVVVVAADDLRGPGALARSRALAVQVRRVLSGPARLRAVTVAVTRVGDGDRLERLAEPFEGLETSYASRLAGATVAVTDAPVTAALPLLWCLHHGVDPAWAGHPDWRKRSRPWLDRAWQAAGDANRYLWRAGSCGRAAYTKGWVTSP